jgi:hypothetical protein
MSGGTGAPAPDPVLGTLPVPVSGTAGVVSLVEGLIGQ